MKPLAQFLEERRAKPVVKIDDGNCSCPCCTGTCRCADMHEEYSDCPKAARTVANTDLEG